MTFYSNPKRDYVLNPRGKALYDGKNSLIHYSYYKNKILSIEGRDFKTLTFVVTTLSTNIQRYSFRCKSFRHQNVGENGMVER